MMSGKRNKVLQLIMSVVNSSDPNAQIFLYGSRARGDARKDSDWDVIVLLDRDNVPYVERSEISCDLWEKGLEIGEEINAFVYTKKQWESAPPSLFKHYVREEGIRL